MSVLILHHYNPIINYISCNKKRKATCQKWKNSHTSPVPVKRIRKRRSGSKRIEAVKEKRKMMKGMKNFRRKLERRRGEGGSMLKR